MRSAAIKGAPWAVAIGGFVGSDVSDPKHLVAQVAQAVKPQVAQLFDTAMVAGFEHLRMAAVNAVNATGGGFSISKSIAVETLIRASAVDQITKAIEAMGVTPRTIGVAVAVFAPTVHEAEEAYGRAAEVLGSEDDSVLEIDDEKLKRLREHFGIGDAELIAAGGRGAVPGLITERGALLSLRR